MTDEKKATLSKNGKFGTRGILHWRLNENATVTTEPDPPPSFISEPDPSQIVTTEPDPPPIFTTEPDPSQIFTVRPVRNSAKRAAVSINRQVKSRAFRRKTVYSESGNAR